MEGVCFEIYSMVLGIEDTIGQKVDLMRVTGGGAKSDFWNQIQASVYNKTIETIVCPEATSLGAAMCAAVGLGEFKDLREAAGVMVQVTSVLNPSPQTLNLQRTVCVV